MPGAGKSTVGVILAKMIAYKFVDTDILIQTEYSMPLQDIVDNLGYLELRRMEENVICSLNAKNSVIATGGSAVYSPKAMKHLSLISKIIFLNVKYETLLNRVDNFSSRGLAKSDNQTLLDLYKERLPLYEKYAHMKVDCDNLSQEDAAKIIVSLVF